MTYRTAQLTANKESACSRQCCAVYRLLDAAKVHAADSADAQCIDALSELMLSDRCTISMLSLTSSSRQTQLKHELVPFLLDLAGNVDEITGAV